MAENYNTRSSSGIYWRYVQAFHEYPGASGRNKPWALYTERAGGRTLAKERHCCQNKVNPVPKKGQTNHYSQAETAKDFLRLNEHQKICALF